MFLTIFFNSLIIHAPAPPPMFLYCKNLKLEKQKEDKGRFCLLHLHLVVAVSKCGPNDPPRSSTLHGTAVLFNNRCPANDVQAGNDVICWQHRGPFFSTYNFAMICNVFTILQSLINPDLKKIKSHLSKENYSRQVELCHGCSS